ncbi:MAG: A/G-specific adenine glycosylase [Bacteroidales bacterium]|jgi:A/G-specific adenine glycosylase|nr:A/G-specific adenine glycosylase [Bacteroidales bacterium]
MLYLQQKLHHWYLDNKRDLPWRHTTDPYRIWVSEIMLQQTQVAQGLPYYLRFMERFDSVQDLANAEEEEVLKLWQGLGYYSRARNLHAAAKQVVNDFDGIFPTNYDALITLKGVGDYTASAVSSFSAGEARACIDGNVIRVICRLFGVDIPYDVGEGQRAIRALADELLSQKDSATHNQAIMEFGALQCTPKNPSCDTCPFQDKCVALDKQQVTELPIKSKKTKVQNLFLYYFVFQQGDKIIIQQRSDSGIWRNMYEFPILESPTKLKKAEVLEHLSEISTLSKAEINFSSTYTHILSHRKIQATFIHVKNENELPQLAKTQSITLSEFDNYPVSRLIERFWENFTPF